MVALSLQTSMTSQTKNAAQILIVDDESYNRDLLCRILHANNSVTAVENGHEALKLLEEQPFDLVLLDIMMPGINGLKVLETMRQTPHLTDLPVILISALSHNEDIVNGLKKGASDYIAKPFDIDVVFARVNTQLKLKRGLDLHKQAIVELKAAQQMQDRLFRIASHDLKSPLSNVRMAESLLREFMDDDPRVTEILDMLKLTVNNMKGVIEEFLDMVAFQIGKIAIYPDYVPTESIVMSVLDLYHSAAAQKQITLTTGDLPGITYADPARLEQILNNLVSNAIKYSPLGATVCLWSEVSTSSIRIYVADQGPGIPANERELLFKEFGKLSPRPTGGESSTGLGLWIVQQMVSLLNGTVGVECPPDGGSIFWVELPKAG